MNFGEKLKYVRGLRNLSLYDLAERSGLSAPYLSEIENSKKRPSTKSLEKIAKALNADAWFFLDDNAVTFEEVAKVNKTNLPEDIMKFVAKSEKLPYLILAKKLDEEGISPETIEQLIRIARNMKKE